MLSAVAAVGVFGTAVVGGVVFSVAAGVSYDVSARPFPLLLLSTLPLLPLLPLLDVPAM